MNKKIVIVLCIGRTGSSALTRSLTILGVNLGNQLLGAVPINPTGLWEDAEIGRINAQALHQLNTEMGQLSLITRENIENQIPDSLRKDAISVLTRKMTSSNLFGFKDIRTYLVLDFWKPIFRQLSLDPIYILAIRNPVSVAHSRKQFGEEHFEEKAYILWFQHVIKSVLNTDGEKRIIVDYDELMENPASQIYRMASVLGIDQSDIDQNAILEYSDGFLSKKLRNNLFSINEINNIPFAPQLILETYKTLKKISQDQINLNDQTAKDFFQQSLIRLEYMSPAIQAIHEIKVNFNKAHQQLEKLILQQVSRSTKISL